MSTRVYPGLYRLVTDHKPEDEWDYHEWYLSGATEIRDTLGRKNGGWTRWNYVACNNPDCPGLALVNITNMIENQVPLVIAKEGT